MIPLAGSALNERQINALDLTGLAELRAAARGSSEPNVLKSAAAQFEGLFLQLVIKSMRESGEREGAFDSEQGRLYQSLLDQQLAQLVGRSGRLGLAAAIERQLHAQSASGSVVSSGASGNANVSVSAEALPFAAPGKVMRSDLPLPQVLDSEAVLRQRFVRAIMPDAEAAARRLGVQTDFIVGQAALESGWGRYLPKFSDGRTSYNLFGIKAGAGWTGPVVEAATAEFSNGVEMRQTERFRAYQSYGEAFADYARLLSENPRYALVRNTSDPQLFAHRMQAAGYASDPLYGTKLAKVIAMVTSLPTIRL